MNKVNSGNASKFIGKEVTAFGFVQDLRLLGKMAFIKIKDVYGVIQIVIKEEQKELMKKAGGLTKESYIEVRGIVIENKQSRTGIEMQPNKIEIITKAEPVPLDTSGKIDSGSKARFDYRFLDLRTPEQAALFRIRGKVFRAVADYFDSKDFICINTPKLTVLGVESGAELFKVDYFGKPAYLSQSPQVYKQMMLSAGFNKVYEVGPVFRAEKSHTTRHLTEFTGIDLEVADIKDENDVMDYVEGLIKHIADVVRKECKDELKMLGKEVNEVKKIPRISMKEAKEMLAKKGKNLKETDDFDAEAEKLLGEIIKKKYEGELIFVYSYPIEIRPFYHMRRNENKNLTKSFDLMWNGTEIATGAQREHRVDILAKQAGEKGLDLSKMKDYEMIFKYGIPKHGGCGLGLDRIVETMLKLENIRDVVLLPRDPERISP